MVPLSPQTADSIVTLLLSKGRLKDDQVEALSKTEQVEGEGPTNSLIQLLESGLCTEQDIAWCIAESYGLPEITLTPDAVDKHAANLLPKSFLQTNLVLPFGLEDGTLKVAIADPSKLTIVPSMRVIADKRNIDIYITTFKNLEDSLYWLGIVEGTPPTDPGIPSPTEEKLKIKSDEPSSDVIDFVNTVVREAIAAKASDIHIERFGEDSRIRYRVDGVLHVQKRFRKFLEEHYNAVSTRLKIMCNANISERRLPQDGAIQFDTEKGIDLRVNFLPTYNRGSERVVMRILNKKGLNVKLEQLGLNEKNGLPKLLAAAHAPQGMVLVTGPTGSGKTTTLYSLLSLINKEGINILTAEDPVEYALSGIGQVQVREEIGFSFNSALRAFLRQDPEVILIGEIRDKDTVEIAIKAALTGHLVFSTLHTNDAPSSIIRLNDMGVPSYLISSALSLVMAQRLARKNCEACRKPDTTVKVEQLVEIGFSQDEAEKVEAQKGKGCQKCGSSGYAGRQGVYEILKITPAVKLAIQEGGGIKEIVQSARPDGYLTLSEVGRQLVADGILSLEEYQRTVMTG